MEKIPAVIIGLGRIASLLEDDALREKPCTHAGAIAASPCLSLAAGCDADEERRRLFAGRWGAPVYADAEEMLLRHKPGLLVVATHPDSHYRYCRLAADRGVPVVICEKPLADTLGRARKIAGLRGLRIITNHERRYSADYIRAKAILSRAPGEGGSLGPLLSVRALLYMGEKRRLVDVLWHDGTHLADALMFLTGGTLKHRRHWGAKLGSRSGTAWLEGLINPPKAGGAPVPFVMEIGAGRDHLVFELEFSCARGRLRIGNGVFEVWESAGSPYAEKFRSLMRTDETFEGKTGYFAAMMADAAACLAERERRPVSSAADGLAVIRYLASVKPWRSTVIP
jgi:predicted dehydrogenase